MTSNSVAVFEGRVHGRGTVTPRFHYSWGILKTTAAAAATLWFGIMLEPPTRPFNPLTQPSTLVLTTTEEECAFTSPNHTTSLPHDTILPSLSLPPPRTLHHSVILLRALRAPYLFSCPGVTSKSSSELARGAKGLIRMEGHRTILEPPDHPSYWSAGSRDDDNYASQKTLYDDLGVDLLDHSFEGFNTCIFALQMGRPADGPDKGIIPLTTSELFNRVEQQSKKHANLSYSVEVSYMEIYNEKWVLSYGQRLTRLRVRDLLNPKNKGNLKVREHPSLGPYVEDLSKLVVENYNQMITLMDEGNKARTVASTNMNETSSRSHAVFTLILTQKRYDPDTKMTGEKVSKISLVDLAGSERQASTGATGTRLKEGANINKSLTTLGKVIAALAQASNTAAAGGKKKKEEFVPYRDSVLTWLLKESLGGNSKTAMIAAISPADYDETLSTLRYADAAKRIKTHAVVNEDPNAKLIRELKEELEVLRSRVSAGATNGEATYDPDIPPEKQIVTYKTKQGDIRTVTKLELQDQLEASEKLMDSLNLTWEEKLAETQKIHLEREKALEDLGITVEKDVRGTGVPGKGTTYVAQMVGVHAPQKFPSLVNLNEDPLMSECLIYQLKPGTTIAGSVDSGKAQVKLSGSHIAEEHCTFVNTDGEVTLEVVGDALTYVNGKRVPPSAPIKLHHGYRVILGDFHVFRFNDPAGVRAHRARMSGMWSNGVTEPGTPVRSDSPAQPVELMDWTAARREVADIESLGNEDLDKLFDDIVKVRTLRGRPDSRLDLTEIESRFMGSVAGDSVDVFANLRDWDHNGTASIAGHDLDNADKVTLVDGETGSRSDARSSMRLSDESSLEQQALTKQLRTLAQEVKRIRSQAAVARARGLSIPEVAAWSPREMVLARKAADQWKKLHNFGMAEEILRYAADIREANVIAKQMKKRISYNFVILDGLVASPTSALDDLGGIIEFDDVSDTCAATTGPRPAIYSWNLCRFQQQLARMRQVLAIKDRPNYSVHLSLGAPFGDSPTPSFSYIGSARAPLQLLAQQVSYSVTVPIFCAYTMEAIGSCRVHFKCSAPSSRSGVSTPESSGPIVQSFPFSHKFSFTVTIDTVKGLTSADFTEVHAQTRLSSLVGPAIASEDTFASLPVNLEQASVSHLALRRTLSVLVTSDMVAHFTSGYASVEFFARVRAPYLERLERFDVIKETPPAPPPAAGDLTPNGSDPERPLMRRAETEFVTAETHDILASVEILEMSHDGEYTATDVEDDLVQLHLGVQRQLAVTFTHASGRALRWSKVVHASAGDIRVVTSDGEPCRVSAADVNMQMASQATFLSDGTSRLTARGTWDSAAHHCIQLDRRTPAADHVVVRLTFMIEVEGVDEPIVLEIDLKTRVISRDARRSSIRLIWRPRPVSNVVSMFAVDLTPPLARTARELWRLDTAKKPVPGDNLLTGWRPRSIALVRDYVALTRVRRLIADVQTSRTVLELAGIVDATKSSEAVQQELLAKYLSLWQHEMDTRLEFDVERETDAEKEMSNRLRRLVPDLEPRLVPTVRHVTPNESIIKRGTLSLLKDSRKNRWEEAQAVLRPPYLHLHPDVTKRETQVINIADASVVASPDVEMLLGRRHAFTVYTQTNSYIVQAVSARELEEWITVIGKQQRRG
ncbi:Kinesin-like protein [Vanrija pseudolonga]|uniref:Kinesin-like protein n=1 Tax=Vanrija pseudolonga TaxID=143232 RepID=A0AAF0Y329_9TREE|nr:Kinesin-like protein [Vanrija pseudolonga]